MNSYNNNNNNNTNSKAFFISCENSVIIVFVCLFVLIVIGQIATNWLTYVVENSSLFCKIITQGDTLFQSYKAYLLLEASSSIDRRPRAGLRSVEGHVGRLSERLQGMHSFAISF